MRPKTNDRKRNCYENRTKRKRQHGNHYDKTIRRTQVPIRSRNSKGSRYAKRKLNKKKVILVSIIFLIFIALIVKAIIPNQTVETSSNDENTHISTANETTANQVQQEEIKQPEPKVKKEITEWNLRLANYENVLPEDFKVEVAEIADDRQFDARAIKYLKQMMNAMGKDGISNVWVQSAYRSVERQKELYDNSVKKYLKQGKTQEEAEKLTDEYINKPGSSDHNLGLAVDFNYVDNKFEDLDAFKWLQENAEHYGFI